MIQSKKKILIADDERALANALTLNLRRSGFEVETVYNGEDVLKMLESQHFDLVLLDLIMPRMDGFMVLEALKGKNTVPIIVSSNLSNLEDTKRVLSLGAKDYFIKSDTSMKEVIEKITVLLAHINT